MTPTSIKFSIFIAILQAAFLCALAMGTAKAEQLDFDFSFTGDPAFSTVDGTVTGVIIDLEDNASSTPFDIILTSVPAGLGLSVPTGGYSLRDHGWNLAEFPESQITVSNGEITSATKYEASLGLSSYLDLNATITYNGSILGVFNGLQYESKYVLNTDGFSGANYSAVSVPEPSGWAMLLSGLVVLGVWHFRSRRQSHSS